MSIQTNELQQLQSILGTDSLLADTAAAGTGRLSLARAAEFFGAELIKPGNPVGAALSNKAALSVQQTVEATSIPARTVEVAAAELPAYINALPRLLMDDLTVKVTNTAAVPFLFITKLYGPGSLTIQVTDGAEVTVQIQSLVDYCTVPITLEGIKLIANASGAGSILLTTYASYLTLRNCVIDREQSTNQYTVGVGSINGSRLLLEQCQITHCSQAIFASMGSIICAVNCTGANNTIGIAVGSGIAMLAGTTPELLGGTVNVHESGLIINKGGELI